MPTGAERPCGAAQMFIQQPHSFGGITAQRGAHQCTMFTLHIAIFIVAERPRPPSIQLGRVAQRERHVAQPLIWAR